MTSKKLSNALWMLLPVMFAVGMVTWILMLPSSVINTFPYNDPSGDPESSSFGNNTIGGSATISVNRVTPTQYMQALASSPRIVLKDNFEQPALSSNWTYAGNTNIDATQGYLSDQSIALDETTAGVTNIPASISNIYGLPSIADEKYKFFMFVNISEPLAYDIGYENEYLAVIINFEDNNQLVYIVAGLYNYPSNATSQVFVLPNEADNAIEYNMWSGISIESIRDDYDSVFMSPMPDISNVTIEFCAYGSDKQVNIDEFQMISVPIQTYEESYWAYNENYDRIWSWRINVNYTVHINTTTINSDDVWVEIQIFLHITDHESNPIIATADTPQFILFDLVKVDSFDTELHWNTTTFYPRANNIFQGSPESEVIYNYTGKVTAYGNIKEISTGNPTDKYMDATKSANTALWLWWVSIDDGDLDVAIELYVIGGGSALVIGGASAYAFKKKRNENNVTDLNNYINQ